MKALGSVWMKLLTIVSTLFFCRADWIDPDTPLDKRTVQSEYPAAESKELPKQYELVFSDEFNTPGRTFEDGTDPRWTALDKNDYTNDALHYYTPENVVTNQEGELVIRSEVADTDVIGFDDVNLQKTHVTKHFRSGMMQTWNKFCFTGGVIEAQMTLPGKSEVGGLWPAFWLLGNLARHTYVSSSAHIWPWSSSECTAKSRDAQLINGCMNTAHYGFQERLGRGSPEIDIFEMQPGSVHRNQGPFLRTYVGQPFMSASYQVAPGRPVNRPGSGYWPGPGQWYDGIEGGEGTAPNIGFYGSYNHFAYDVDPSKSDYWSDAISYNKQLDQHFWQEPHTYRLEWEVPSDTTDGYLRWFLDKELVLSINGTGLVDAGYGAEISSEPMYLILNTAISKQWGFPFECPVNCPCETSKYDCSSDDWGDTCGFSDKFCEMMSESTPTYKIDWVRVYQDPSNELHKVGCSTPERPTRRFISANEDLYKSAGDAHPLKGIQRGRGSCTHGLVGETKESCGGPKRGRCTEGHECECAAGWTGPHCLASQGWDPVLYDQPDKISDIGFIPPSVRPRGLIIGFCVLLSLFLLVWVFRDTADRWTPVPIKKS